MALTRITKGVIKPNENYDTHNINSTGIITAIGFKGPFTGSSDIQSGIITATKIDLNGDIDVDGHTNLDNVSIAGVVTATTINATTFSGAISGGAISGTTGTFSGNVSIGGTLTYEDVTNIDSVGLVTARDGVFIPDNKKLELGNAAGSGDLTIKHFAGGHSYITDTSNNIVIQTGALRVVNAADNQNLATFSQGGASDLYFAGAKKITTASSGVNVVGTTTTGQLAVTGISTFSGTILANAGVTITDNQYLNLGAANGSDARLWHDNTGGGHTYLFSYHSSGVLKIADDTNVILGKTTNYNYINCTPTTVELFSGGNKKLETTSYGTKVTGDLNVTGVSTIFPSSISSGGRFDVMGGGDENTQNAARNEVIRIGRGDILGSYHHSIWSATGSGSDASHWLRFYLNRGAVGANNQIMLMQMTSNGFIGIKEESPDKDLHISNVGSGGYIKLENTATSISNGTHCGGLVFAHLDSSGAGDVGNIRAEMEDTSTGAGQLCFSTGTPSSLGTRMTIKSTGEVGIGIANPSVKLDVNGVTKSTIFQLKKVDDATNIGAYLQLTNQAGDSNSNDVTLTAAHSTNSVVLRGAVKVSSWTYHNGGWQERLHIANNGDIGINDSSPTFKLDVNGTGRFTDDLTIDTGKKIKSSSSQGNITIQPGPSYPGGSIKFAGGQSGATDRGTMIFYAGETTSLQERMRLLSDGRVGVNTSDPRFNNSNSASGNKFYQNDPKFGTYGSITIGNLSSTATDVRELAFYRRGGPTPGTAISNHHMGRLSWYGSSNDSAYPDMAWALECNPNGGGWTAGSNRHGYLSFVSGRSGELIRIKHDAKVSIGFAGAPTSRVHIKGNSDNGTEDATVTIDDLDDTAGSKEPILAFDGGGTRQARILSSDATSTTSSTTGGLFFGVGSSNHTVLQCTGMRTVKVHNDVRGWSTVEYNSIRQHQKMFYSPGNAVATHDILRIRRYWWGWGHYKIRCKAIYYNSSFESTWFVNGHGSGGNSYSIANETYGGDASSNTWNCTITHSASGNSPGGGSPNVWYTDVKVNVPNYHYTVVWVEAWGSSYSTDPTSMHYDSYCLM